jgi:hypothetical protein
LILFFINTKYKMPQTREEILLRQREYYKKNREAKLAYQNEYNKKHPDRQKAYYKTTIDKRREYYLKNREKKLAYQNEYTRKNKEKIQEYIKDNKDKIISRSHKKVAKICRWEQQGMICYDWDTFWDIWVSSNTCEDCDCVFSEERKLATTTKCLDHDHDITDGENLRGIVCLACNTRRK